MTTRQLLNDLHTYELDIDELLEYCELKFVHFISIITNRNNILLDAFDHIEHNKIGIMSNEGVFSKSNSIEENYTPDLESEFDSRHDSMSNISPVSKINEMDLEHQEKRKQLESELQNLREKSQEINQLRLKVNQLREIVRMQDKLIDPFRIQLQDFQKEYQTILERNSLEKNMEKLTTKYSHILAYNHNIKKIRIMVELKKSNYEIQQNNTLWEMKLQKREKYIRKLTSSNKSSNSNCEDR